MFFSVRFFTPLRHETKPTPLQMKINKECVSFLSFDASANLEKSFNRTQLPFPKMAKRVGANQFHFLAFSKRKKNALGMKMNSAAK